VPVVEGPFDADRLTVGGGRFARRSGMGGHALPESPRILIADDSADSRTLCRLWLTDAGYLVHEAGDGAEALTLARRHRVDVILMDLQMPVMDGMEAIRQLRADSMTAACRFSC